jgi:hypothetical protein
MGPTVAENMLYRNMPHTPKNLRHQSRGELAGRCGGYRNEILFHCMLNKCTPPGPGQSGNSCSGGSGFLS